MAADTKSKGLSLLVVLHNLRIIRALHFVAFICSIHSIFTLSKRTEDSLPGYMVYALVSLALPTFFRDFFICSRKKQIRQIEMTTTMMHLCYFIMFVYSLDPLFEHGVLRCMIEWFVSMVCCYILCWIMEYSIWSMEDHTPAFTKSRPFISSVVYCLLFPLDMVQSALRVILCAAGYFSLEQEESGDTEQKENKKTVFTHHKIEELISKTGEPTGHSSVHTEQNMKEQARFYDKGEATHENDEETGHSSVYTEQNMKEQARFYDKSEETLKNDEATGHYSVYREKNLNEQARFSEKVEEVVPQTFIDGATGHAPVSTGKDMQEQARFLNKDDQEIKLPEVLETRVNARRYPIYTDEQIMDWEEKIFALQFESEENISSSPHQGITAPASFPYKDEGSRKLLEDWDNDVMAPENSPLDTKETKVHSRAEEEIMLRNFPTEPAILSSYTSMESALKCNHYQNPEEHKNECTISHLLESVDTSSYSTTIPTDDSAGSNDSSFEIIA